jgi:cyclic dehypoxanthinyl futalosine synthase
VAISRLYLDNIPHITSGYVTEGMKLAQVALSFGCDDMGGTLMQEEVVAATGTGTPSTNLSTLIESIRGAGKIPAQRDSEYHILRRF